MTKEVAERLEILNNGSHLGWADVIGGEWNYSHSGLGVGVYSITAKYKGKLSSAWQLTVREPTVEEKFEDAPIGNFESLSRPHFTIRLVKGDAWGRNTSVSYNSLNITSYLPVSMAGRALCFNITLGGMDYNYPHLDQVVDLEFVEEYSSISFTEAHAISGRAGVGTFGVEAFDRNGHLLTGASFYGGSEAVRFQIGSPDTRKISRLRFSMSARPLSDQQLIIIWLNNVVMTV